MLGLACHSYSTPDDAFSAVSFRFPFNRWPRLRRSARGSTWLAIRARFVAQPAGARAVYNGRPGHQVVLGREQMRDISRLSGDRGARGLLGDGPRIECGDLCSGRDVDTPEDLEAIRDEARAVI